LNTVDSFNISTYPTFTIVAITTDTSCIGWFVNGIGERNESGATPWGIAGKNGNNLMSWSKTPGKLYNDIKVIYNTRISIFND
jgi:hypothetical protein